MFNSKEIATITYALICVKVIEQNNSMDNGKTIGEINALLDKIRNMKGVEAL